MQNCSLLSPNRYPVSNAAEVFYSDTTTGAFSQPNNLLADNVVCVSCKKCLFAREFSEMPVCGFRVRFLKCCSQPAVSKSNVFEF